MSKLVWKTETRKLKDLIPTEKNPRYMSEFQKGELKKSLEKFNLVEIPVINTTNKILAGHQRISVLLAIGELEEIEVRVPSRELNADEEKEYLLRSNKNVGEWDMSSLLENFEKDFLWDIGFDKVEIPVLDVNEINSTYEEDEYSGLPEFKPKDSPFTLTVHFKDEELRKEFCEKYGIEVYRKTKQAWSTCYPYKDRDDLNSVSYE